MQMSLKLDVTLDSAVPSWCTLSNSRQLPSSAEAWWPSFSPLCFVLYCFFLFLLFFLVFEDQKWLPLPKIRKIKFYFNVRMRERYYHWCGRHGRCSAHWREAFGDFLENPLPAALQGPFVPHPQSLPFTELYRTSGMAVLIPRATRF